MINGKEPDYRFLTNNELTLNLLKDKNIFIPIKKDEKIVSKIGLNSEIINFPARLNSCEHIEVVELDNLKKFIKGQGFCPICGNNGSFNDIYVDYTLHQIFTLIKPTEESFVVINNKTKQWKAINENKIYTDDDYYFYKQYPKATGKDIVDDENRIIYKTMAIKNQGIDIGDLFPESEYPSEGILSYSTQPNYSDYSKEENTINNEEFIQFSII